MQFQHPPLGVLTYRWIFLTVAFFSITRAETSPGLSDNVQIKERTESQKFSPDCSARREWIEVSGAKGAPSINAQIKREMTIGKKLKAADCPDPKYKENYEYLNTARRTGRTAKALGIEYGVHFPGGSGRHVFDCRVFSLESGKAYDLSKNVTKEGKKLIGERVCAGVKKVAPELSSIEDYCSGKESPAFFCLTDAGIQARVMTYNNLAPLEVDLETDLVKKSFRWPADLGPL